jgi:hypothetical protein
MKILSTLALVMGISSHAYSDDKSQLFNNPLILGASVSAGHGTSQGGPGDVISRLINPKTKIDNRARSGRTSIESTRDLNISELSPSIILALDLFFWDAARDRYNKSFEENTTKLFNSIFERKIPLIVGKVPIGVEFPLGIREAGKRKSAKKINDFLERTCTPDKNCILYDLRECFNQMDSPKYFSDALHTTDEGNLFCAQIFVKGRPYQGLTITPK